MVETVLEGLEGRWWLVGVAAAVGVAKAGRPLIKGAIKGYLVARDGVARVAAGTREGMRQLYDEAVLEYHSADQPVGEEEPKAEGKSRRSRRSRSTESGGVALAPPAAGAV